MRSEQANYLTIRVGGKRINLEPLTKEQTKSMDSFDNEHRLANNRYLTARLKEMQK